MFTIRILVKIIKIDSVTIIFREKFRTLLFSYWLLVGGKVTINVPNHSDKVTYCQDNDNQLECFKEVGNHQNEHDVVVIEVTIFGELWFILDDSFQVLAEKHFYLSHKGI